MSTAADSSAAAQQLRKTELLLQIKTALLECGLKFEMLDSAFYIGETQQIRCSVIESDGNVNVLWESDGTVSPSEMQQCQKLVGAKLEARLGPLTKGAQESDSASEPTTRRAKSRENAGKSKRKGKKGKAVKKAAEAATSSSEGKVAPPAGKDEAAPAEQQQPPDWEGPWGDRRIELVVIGQDMDHAAMQAALEECLMTEKEMTAYTAIFGQAKPPWLKDQLEPVPEPAGELTYKVGDRVQCNCERNWRKGEVVKLWYRDDLWEAGRYAPYQVKLESGDLIYVPRDTSTLIKPQYI